MNGALGSAVFTMFGVNAFMAAVKNYCGNGDDYEGMHLRMVPLMVAGLRFHT